MSQILTVPYLDEHGNVCESTDVSAWLSDHAIHRSRGFVGENGEVTMNLRLSIFPHVWCIDVFGLDKDRTIRIKPEPGSVPMSLKSAQAWFDKEADSLQCRVVLDCLAD